MKINREYFDTYEWNGKKVYTPLKIDDGINAYSDGITEIWYESDTNEKIGYVKEADNWTNYKSYYCASCLYGWDGAKKTKKNYVARLCTKADYTTARALLMNEYKIRREA